MIVLNNIYVIVGDRIDHRLVTACQLWNLCPCNFLRCCVWLIQYLPATLRAAQTCRYLIYSEADFEVFPTAGATRWTDGGEIWHGGGDRAKFHPYRCNDKGPQN